jgi:hypothetical protein
MFLAQLALLLAQRPCMHGYSATICQPLPLLLRRLDQLVTWLGGSSGQGEALVIFDECHRAKSIKVGAHRQPGALAACPRAGG